MQRMAQIQLSDSACLSSRFNVVVSSSSQLPRCYLFSVKLNVLCCKEREKLLLFFQNPAHKSGNIKSITRDNLARGYRMILQFVRAFFIYWSFCKNYKSVYVFVMVVSKAFILFCSAFAAQIALRGLTLANCDCEWLQCLSLRFPRMIV